MREDVCGEDGAAEDACRAHCQPPAEEGADVAQGCAADEGTDLAYDADDCHVCCVEFHLCKLLALGHLC